MAYCRPEVVKMSVTRETLATERAVAQAPATGEAHRPLRADARRNHDKLVAAAREVFAAEGGGASMEAVANKAGVGTGTLYRHFPRRIDLVQAVYEDDVEDLVRSAQQAVAALEPWPSVVAFLEAFTRYARAKRTLLNELREAFDRDPGTKSRLRERVEEATALVIGRAQRAGVVRGDIEGKDVVQLLGPVCSSPTLTDEQALRLLPVVLDGLRANATTSSAPTSSSSTPA